MKNFDTKKMGLMSQLSESLIVVIGFKLCNILHMMSCFSAIQRSLSLFCCFLFAVFIDCWYTRSSFSFNYYTKLITYTANNHLNPKLIPELLNNIGVNACDVMLKLWHKSQLYWPRNYYNDDNFCRPTCYLFRWHCLMAKVSFTTNWIKVKIVYLQNDYLWNIWNSKYIFKTLSLNVPIKTCMQAFWLNIVVSVLIHWCNLMPERSRLWYICLLSHGYICRPISIII